FQAAIESLNGRWQTKVWARFEHASLQALQAQSYRYVEASRDRTAIRQEEAPDRRAFPPEWRLTKQLLKARPEGTVLKIRRTNDRGEAIVLGRTYLVDPNWPHRL